MHHSISLCVYLLFRSTSFYTANECVHLGLCAHALQNAKHTYTNSTHSHTKLIKWGTACTGGREREGGWREKVSEHFRCTLSHSNELLAFKMNICFFRFIFFSSPFLISFLHVWVCILVMCALRCTFLFSLYISLFIFMLALLHIHSFVYLRLHMVAYGSGISCLCLFTCDMWNTTTTKYKHVSIPFHSSGMPYIGRMLVMWTCNAANQYTYTMPVHVCLCLCTCI